MARIASEVVSLVGTLGQVLKSERRTCPVHGDYTDHLTGLGRSRAASWKGCSHCSEDKRAEDTRIEQQAMLRDNVRRSIEGRVGRACIPRRFADRSLEGYRTGGEGQARALNICSDYAVNFPAHARMGRSLMLLGTVGTGKTHLAAAIGNYIMRQFGLAALYVTASSVVRHVKATFSNDSSHTEVQAYKLFEAPDLLILDEVGVQNVTEFERTVMFEVINSRYEAMKPTIVVSNRSKEELPTFMGDRVVDRLRENGGKLVLFTWESARGTEGGHD
ncbi:ATP-binding protein [Pseudomonas sp. NPDC087358]|uniref:ATP-binding protein n=1 Tax=Pseudomonas sp. NPDC087358 TaxID=3364439 RepID=UPI00384AE687